MKTFSDEVACPEATRPSINKKGKYIVEEDGFDLDEFIKESKKNLINFERGLCMIKNIILDVGGVIFDDSKTNVERLLGKDVDHIYKVAYGSVFKKCLLGEMSIKEYIDSLKDEDEFEDIKYILEKDNLEKSYPLMKDNFEYVKELKKNGFRLFLLTNITKESHKYIDSVVNIDKIFDGGIYSYQEHLVKPNYEIYELIIKKYNLNKDETLFFDDKVKNVNAANECGIRSFIFTSIDDIKSKIM